MKFYRYEIVQYASKDFYGEYISSKFPNPKLICRDYNLYKETLKGYWIGYGFMTHGSLRSQCHWVSKTARKRYAYPTKEEALLNFEKRTKKRMKILEYQRLSCSMALGSVERERKKIENEYKTGS